MGDAPPPPTWTAAQVLQDLLQSKMRCHVSVCLDPKGGQDGMPTTLSCTGAAPFLSCSVQGHLLPGLVTAVSETHSHGFHVNLSQMTQFKNRPGKRERSTERHSATTTLVAPEFSGDNPARGHDRTSHRQESP